MAEDYLAASAFDADTELLVVFDEHGAEIGNLVAEARARSIATLQVMDGILEWRRTWAYPTSRLKRPLNQPALADKIACLGWIDFRLLTEWGNVGRCEIVGCTRFDRAAAAYHRPSTLGSSPSRILVMTAKTPGFSAEQLAAVEEALSDLRDTFSSRPDLIPVWRVTGGLSEKLGLTNTLRSTISNELEDILTGVDAVISTPSTAIVQAMLAGKPAALLDYTNSPHLVATPWRITAKVHIQKTLDSLTAPTTAESIYQDWCLRQALDIRPDATGRLLDLARQMREIRRQCLHENRPVRFPQFLLPTPEPAQEVLGNLQQLYPHHEVYALHSDAFLQSRLEAALGTITLLENRLAAVEARWQRLPGFKTFAKVARAMRARQRK